MSPTNTPKKPSKGLLKTFKAAVKKIGRRTPGASPAIADEIDVATVLDASDSDTTPADTSTEAQANSSETSLDIPTESNELVESIVRLPIEGDQPTPIPIEEDQQQSQARNFIVSRTPSSSQRGKRRRANSNAAEEDRPSRNLRQRRNPSPPPPTPPRQPRQSRLKAKLASLARQLSPPPRVLSSEDEGYLAGPEEIPPNVPVLRRNPVRSSTKRSRQAVDDEGNSNSESSSPSRNPPRSSIKRSRQAVDDEGDSDSESPSPSRRRRGLDGSAIPSGSNVTIEDLDRATGRTRPPAKKVGGVRKEVKTKAKSKGNGKGKSMDKGKCKSADESKGKAEPQDSPESKTMPTEPEERAPKAIAASSHSDSEDPKDEPAPPSSPPPAPARYIDNTGNRMAYDSVFVRPSDTERFAAFLDRHFPPVPPPRPNALRRHRRMIITEGLLPPSETKFSATSEVPPEYKIDMPPLKPGIKEWRRVPPGGLMIDGRRSAIQWIAIPEDASTNTPASAPGPAPPAPTANVPVVVPAAMATAAPTTAPATGATTVATTTTPSTDSASSTATPDTPTSD